MKKFKTFRMFISAATEEIKDSGVVCVGWQLQKDGEQENCFHYFHSSSELSRYIGLKGIEYAEIHTKYKEGRIYFFYA